MSERTPEGLARWEKIRGIGAIRYILSRSLAWGLFLFVFISVKDALEGSHFLVSRLEHPNCLFLLLAFGLFCASVTWLSFENAYRKAREAEAKHIEPENIGNAAKA